MEGGGRSLSCVRREIDELDRSLVRMFAERLALAREASERKAANGRPGIDHAREAEVVRLAAVEARERGLEPEIVRGIFWRLVGLSHWGRAR